MKTVYLISYKYQGEVRFVRLKSETFEEASALAACMFGELAPKVLYKKEFVIKD